MSYINDNEITYSRLPISQTFFRFPLKVQIIGSRLYFVFESSSTILWCHHSNGTSQPYFFDVICSFFLFYYKIIVQELIEI